VKPRAGRRQPAGSVRIIGGALRRRRLPVPELPGLRPTPDRLRETLFNWLAGAPAGARCLDLYAGTGALGFEAASRGAASVDMVESAPPAAAALAESAARLQVHDVRIHAVAAEPWLLRAEGPFDIVFLDPPYGEQAWSRACALLAERKLLARPAWVFVEGPAERETGAPALPGWRLHRQSRTGGATGLLYRID